MGSADDTLAAMVEIAADRLGAYGYVLTGSQTEGEELVQDAIVKVFARRTRFDAPAQAEAYVRRTMRTMHVDRMRRETLWRRVMPGQAREEAQPDEAQAFPLLGLADAPDGWFVLPPLEVTGQDLPFGSGLELPPGREEVLIP